MVDKQTKILHRSTTHNGLKERSAVPLLGYKCANKKTVSSKKKRTFIWDFIEKLQTTSLMVWSKVARSAGVYAWKLIGK